MDILTIPWNWGANRSKSVHTTWISTKCRCGKTILSLEGAPSVITICHCAYCRKEKLKERMEDVDDDAGSVVSSASTASSSGCSQVVGPLMFLGFEKDSFEFQFDTDLVEGPNDARHSCRRCGQLAFVAPPKCKYVYINSGLFGFSERFSRQRFEHLSNLHARGECAPFVANVWCKSEEDFEPEYRHWFDWELPFFCWGLGISPKGRCTGRELSRKEVKLLRSGCGSLSRPVNENENRVWTNEELKRVFNAAKFDRLEELKGYVEEGAPVDCTPYGSQSPAYIAAFYGKLRSLKYLTKANADMNKVEKDGFTPAHAASSEGHVDCLRWLHENGGLLDKATTTGQTCLSLARRANRAECIQFLESILHENKWNPAELKKVFDAAKSGRLEELKSYINNGAPVDCTPYGSQTPMYIACFYGRDDCLEFLAEHGADLNKTEKDGFTPAHAAASEGHVSCLEKLYRLGGNLTYTTDGGQSCYTLAERADKVNVLRWIESNFDLPMAGVE